LYDVFIQDIICNSNRPRKDKNNDQRIHAAGEKGMLARGHELVMELVTPPSQEKEFRK
jgi:hypothetical protein